VNLVVDTSVWSLVLRRDTVNERDAHVRTFRSCIEAGHGLFILGPILQELLDGLRSDHQFSRLLSVLDPVPLASLNRSTYVMAARMRNDCRKQGVQAGAIDFLIAAACVESGYPLLTADRDFARIANCTELLLVPIQA
jgi:predicted nucleic acid-binding protein